MPSLWNNFELANDKPKRTAVGLEGFTHDEMLQHFFKWKTTLTSAVTVLRLLHRPDSTPSRFAGCYDHERVLQIYHQTLKTAPYFSHVSLLQNAKTTVAFSEIQAQPPAKPLNWSAVGIGQPQWREPHACPVCFYPCIDRDAAYDHIVERHVCDFKGGSLAFKRYTAEAAVKWLLGRMSPMPVPPAITRPPLPDPDATGPAVTEQPELDWWKRGDVAWEGDFAAGTGGRVEIRVDAYGANADVEVVRGAGRDYARRVCRAPSGTLPQHVQHVRDMVSANVTIIPEWHFPATGAVVGSDWIEFAPWIDGGDVAKGDHAGLQTFAQVATFLASLRNAVGQLHSRGFAHGDIKPQNLLVANDGTARIIDWDSCASPRTRPRRRRPGTTLNSGTRRRSATYSRSGWSPCSCCAAR